MTHTVNDVPVIDFSLKGKVAFVSGGSKGLGYATAVTFARYGASVAICARTQSDLDRAVEDLKSIGCDAMAVRADLTVQADIDNAFAQVVAKYGKIDIAVCNAGAANTIRAVEVTAADWDHVVDIDLKAVFFTAQAAAKQMIKQGTGGRIINISSAAGVTGSKGIAAYCAAKGGVIQMTKSLALEWARDGITVNAICPGYFPTSLSEYVTENPKYRKGLEDHTAVKRLGTFDEIVAPILMLASNHSGYMTGTHILIDGGGAAS